MKENKSLKKVQKVYKLLNTHEKPEGYELLPVELAVKAKIEYKRRNSKEYKQFSPDGVFTIFFDMKRQSAKIIMTGELPVFMADYCQATSELLTRISK